MGKWLGILAALAFNGLAFAADPPGDPFWMLLHEPAARAELKLSAEQQKSFQSLIDGLDLRFFPLRNQGDAAFGKGLAQLVSEAHDQLPKLVNTAQVHRLDEILLRQLGVPGLLKEPVATRMAFSTTQRSGLETIIHDGQAKLSDLEQRVSKGEPRGPLEKSYSETQVEMQKQVLALLTPEQKTTWKELVGADFDTSQLGHAGFKAPELIDSGKWLNGGPLRLEKLRGKVVVLHFYACDCGNCINNLPWYKKWHEQFHSDAFEMIGIHTPETSNEREVPHVQEAAQKEKLAFPILIDDRQANWNAWGNGIWPAVYLIDKQGYLRRYWLGELNWQGGNGEEQMRHSIEALLKEPARQKNDSN
jgi:peroxiredoxin